MTLIYVVITALVFTTLELVSKLIADQVNPFAITCLRYCNSVCIALIASLDFISA